MVSGGGVGLFGLYFLGCMDVILVFKSDRDLHQEVRNLLEGMDSPIDVNSPNDGTFTIVHSRATIIIKDHFFGSDSPHLDIQIRPLPQFVHYPEFVGRLRYRVSSLPSTGSSYGELLLGLIGATNVVMVLMYFR